MQTRPLLHVLTAIAATSLCFACADDGKGQPGADEVGDGDGDKGTETTGDGDGEATGDGDGEATTGDGDGEATGDGDGEATGDGDGEASECETLADTLAPDLTQEDGGCTTIVRFNYETFEPISWASHCAPAPKIPLTEDEARKLSDCCRDGVRLDHSGDEMFLLYTKPAPDGGATVISNHLAELSWEASIKMGSDGDILHPSEWATPENLGKGCGAKVPEGVGYDLTMDGKELDSMMLDKVLAAFADTALTGAIEKEGRILNTVILAYPRTVEPVDSAKSEYIMIIESGTKQ